MTAWLSVTNNADTHATYPNSCFAGCAGATAMDSGVCAECAALCPEGELPADLDKPFCAPEQCVLYDDGCVPTKCLIQNFELGNLIKNDCPESCIPMME